MWSNGFFYMLPVGMYIGTTTLENLVLSAKVVDGHTLCPTVPLLSVYPRENLAHGLREISSIRMFLAVLFVIAKTGSKS